jgi:hypothetical protein
MKTYQTFKVLPQNMILCSAESHLYRIGLCLISETYVKRSKFHSPLLIFIINIVVLLKSIISLLLPEDNKYLLIVNGEFSYFLGLRTHFNITIFWTYNIISPDFTTNLFL